MFEGNNLPHELFLTTRQITKLRNAFENNLAADIELSKTQIFKIIQSGGLLGSLLIKIEDPLMKASASIEKLILAPFGITAVALAIDEGIQKKIHDSGATSLTISSKEMNGIMKIIPALEDSNILLKGITK